MEYPTFITLGTHPVLGLAPFQGVRTPQLVTIHEFGHQYFQGMSASNEFEEAWLDEGINSYYEMVVMEETYDADTELPGLLKATGFENNHASIAGGHYSDSLSQPAWSYLSGSSYGKNSYPRPAVTLRHLEGLLGPATFHRAMRSFFQRYRFHHPDSSDFESAIQEAAGQDLGWFFRQALHSSRTLDYAITKLDNDRVRKPRGYFWVDGKPVETGGDESADDGDEVAADDGASTTAASTDEEVAADDDEDDDGAKTWRSRAVVFRRGEFVHPVTVELRFDDGRTLRREWAGARRWARWTFVGPAKLVSAEVDPDHVMALDVDRLNNGRRAEADRTPGTAFVADILYWLQTLFHAASLLA
jgi:hypothetical protein